MQTEITKDTIRNLPASTGVYFFKKNEDILYVGKAISIKARILSHYENAKLDPKEALIFKHSNKIEFVLTDSEFKALLLESSLIQKYKPKYNSRWKDDKSYLYIKITIKDEFPKVFTVRRENDQKSAYFGPFPSQRDAQTILRAVRRFFPFCQQPKIAKRACFYAKIGLCSPCPSEIAQQPDPQKKANLKKIYRKNIRNLMKVLSGDIDLVLKDSYSELKTLTKEQNYEQALILRNKIQSFERLIYQSKFSSDISVDFNRSGEALSGLEKSLKKYFVNINSLSRIECYDISNLMQKEATASMVVFTDGMPNKSQYRKFKIKSQIARSDFEMLEEVFIRRFNNDWPLPDLLVVDGGTPQVLRVKNVLRNIAQSDNRLLKTDNQIPLIGIAKHPDRIVIDLGDKLLTRRPSINDLGFNLVRALRDEAHRFAKKYHLLLRSKKLLL